MQHCQERGSGTIRTLTKEQHGAGAYPYDPDGHDPLHLTLALGHGPHARLAIITGRGKGDLEDLVGVVDVEEQVGEAENRDDRAHVVRLTTVVSPNESTSVCV